MTTDTSEARPVADYPRMRCVRQHFALPPPLDLRPELTRQLAGVRGRVKPQAHIGVAVGSRGIARLAEVVTAVLEFLLAAGARPFLIPAMGSHGGATPEGQREILAAYGLTEQSLGVPIRDGMDVTSVGGTAEGHDVMCSIEALRADGVVVVNRIKPHTDFHSDTLGSGLLKMLVVGLGKAAGAAQFHAAATRWGHERVIRAAARTVLKTAPVLFGVGLLENQVHDLAQIAVIPAPDLERCEAGLFATAKRWMPRLPVDEIDLLIVDRLGKNISGTGMDPHIIGRQIHGYSTVMDPAEPHRPRVRRLFVRDLTPETHGNAIGIGMADFTTTRLVAAMDRAKTYLNALTSLSLNGAKIPLHFATDREAIRHALATLALPDARQAKVVRLRDTLSVELLQWSESCAASVGQAAALEAIGPWAPMEFGPDGNLVPFAGGCLKDENV